MQLMRAPAETTPPPIGLVASASMFGVFSILLWLTTTAVIPWLRDAFGVAPIIGWYVSGPTLVLVPVLLLAPAALVECGEAGHERGDLAEFAAAAGDRSRTADLPRRLEHLDRVLDPTRLRRPATSELGEHLREVGEARLGEDWAQSLADTGGDPYERSLDAWELAEVVSVLSPEHRAVLVETYYHGASVAQAAKTLGIPPGTVKSRTYYALRALRLACEERGVTP